MELSELEQAFVIAGAEIEFARNKVFETSEKVIQARGKLETAKMEALQSGKIDGKNETERKAQLSAATFTLAGILETAERDERYARYEFDADMFAFDILRYRLRIAELAAKKQE